MVHPKSFRYWRMSSSKCLTAAVRLCQQLCGSGQPPSPPFCLVPRSSFFLNTNVWAQLSDSTFAGAPGKQRLGRPVGAVAMHDDLTKVWASSDSDDIGLASANCSDLKPLDWVFFHCLCGKPHECGEEESLVHELQARGEFRNLY